MGWTIGYPTKWRQARLVVPYSSCTRPRIYTWSLRELQPYLWSFFFHPRGTRVYTFSEEADATPHEQSRRDHTASVPLKQREACTYTGPNSMLFGYVLPIPRKLHSYTMNCFFFYFRTKNLKVKKNMDVVGILNWERIRREMNIFLYVYMLKLLYSILYDKLII